MKNRIVKKILRIILLVLVGAAVIGTFYFLWKKAQPVITVYEIVTPEKGDVETKTVATGNVEPRFEVEIKPQISGIISELKKEAGQMVQAGEIIAIIKVIPEMVQLNSAESRVNLANISLKQVEETYKRDTQLFKQGVIAQEDFDLSKANYLKAVEEKDNAQSALEIIRDGIAKNSSVASTTQIRSTITGMILDIPVKVGNSVIQANNFNDGTTIATVANMNDMIFKGNVDETEIGRIHEGMPIKLTVGDMETLLEDVSAAAYDKAVEVVTDVVRTETRKEDMRMIEDTKKWVLSPERKAPQSTREYTAKHLDSVLDKFLKTMQTTAARLQEKLLKPEVRQKGKEQVKEKARDSVLQLLNRLQAEQAQNKPAAQPRTQEGHSEI